MVIVLLRFLLLCPWTRATHLVSESFATKDYCPSSWEGWDDVLSEATMLGHRGVVTVTGTFIARLLRLGGLFRFAVIHHIQYLGKLSWITRVPIVSCSVSGGLIYWHSLTVPSDLCTVWAAPILLVCGSWLDEVLACHSWSQVWELRVPESEVRIYRVVFKDYRLELGD